MGIRWQRISISKTNPSINNGGVAAAGIETGVLRTKKEPICKSFKDEKAIKGIT
jgi:hypothetical protein